MNQKMVLNDELEFLTKTNLQADFTMDPITYYVKGDMSTSDPATGDGIEQDLELYSLQDSLYIYDSTSDDWFELPSEGTENLLGQTADLMDASEQLRQLELLITDFKVEEKRDKYIFTLDAATEKFTDYIIEQLGLLTSLGTPFVYEGIYEEVTYDKVSYVIKINKDTFDLTTMDLELSMTIENVEGFSVLETDSNITFSNFNSFEEIEVPQNVIDHAVKMH